MNKTFLLGRLTKDAELKKTTQGTSVTAFSLAVNRNFKDENGETKADFLDIVAWDRTAEAICNNTKKGHRLLIEGRTEKRSYETSNGETRWVTEIIAERVEFIEPKERETFGKDPVHGQERVTPQSDGLPF